MPERRRRDRRTNPAVPEPLDRKKERRQGDRRESLRKPASFTVRFDDTHEVVSGDLGLGGASFTLSRRPANDTVTVELKPGRAVLSLPGTVSSVRAARTSLRHVQVRFAELDTKTELALAKWLDGVAD
ncbi:MAG: PilZ domain-containing protein [Myxococcaceae bacterium]|nr:PilZ domain-containing protein [Myxococcaceae bacterium]